MPADIAGEVIGGVVRVAARFIIEVVFEFAIQGTGDLILRTIRPRSEPGDAACALVGLLFWGGFATGVYWLYRLWAGA